MKDDELMGALEKAAAPLRLQGEMVVPALPERHALREARWGWRRWTTVASAAMVLVAGMLWMVQQTIPDQSPYSWSSVAGLAGITEDDVIGSPVAFGEEIFVSDVGRVVFDIGDIGSVELGAGSRMTVLPPLDPQGDGRFRLSLQEGQMDVFVVAPARAFLVETPWFDVWDLGCRYTITLDANGNGSLAVDLGAVRCEGVGFGIDIPAGKSLDFVDGQPSSSEPR
ncbi:MAG: hypothetical protein ACYTEP_12895 [Planctomycetota bacterium]|jgi:ferric-dicitrate binding protein FerR (iron transport regulator)